MADNPLLQSIPPRTKLIIFIGFLLLFQGLGAIVLYVAATQFFNIATTDLVAIFENPTAEYAEALKWMNNITQLVGFLTPVVLFTLIFGQRDVYHLSMNKTHWIWFTTPLWFVLAGPAIDFTGTLNTWLIDLSGNLESTVKPMEEKNHQLIEAILGSRSTMSILTTFLTIAIIPAICEEFVFRGTLQPLVYRATGKVHAAIWATAIFFSFIHFQFYGFIPRIILGALLGYAVYWSGSIWTGIVLHFFNNGLGILFYYMNNNSLTVADDHFSNQWWAIIISFVVSGAIAYFYYLRRTTGIYVESGVVNNK